MPVPVAVAAGAAAKQGAQTAVTKGAQAGGKAVGGVAKKAAKGAANATKNATKHATKHAAQNTAKGTANATRNATKGAAGTAKNAAGNAKGLAGNAPPALRGGQPATARPRGGPQAPTNRGPASRPADRAAKQANRGGKLPEKPSKQLRNAINNARDGKGNGKDDKKRNRRKGIGARTGQNLRKDLAKQARGGKEREQDGAEEAAEEIARRTGRRTKRLLFLDRDQFFRRTVRRTLIVVVLVLALLAYPAMTIWASTATDHEPEQVLDDGLSSMTNGLGAGPIPEALIPVVAEATGIPVDALRAYSSAAGGEWPIDWRIMAGIGKVECDHGRSTALYCSTPHNVWDYGNGSGERGPMQHLGHLWRVGENDPFDPHVEGPPTPVNKDSTHVATDGNGDGIADPWNWFDATHSAARKLTLYREELRAKGDAYDTDEFMIAAYNAGVGGATRNGSNIADIPNKAYLDKVLAERDRIQEATASLGFAIGSTACPVVVPRGPTKALNPTHVTPATAAMANNTVACFGNEYSVGCYSPRDGTYEHPRGRACDFMITAGGNMPDSARRVHGTAMAEWHVANAKAFNLLYVIWYGKIWSVDRDGTYKPWSQWRTYTTGGVPCSSPSSCGVTAGHYDHVHVSVKLMPGDPAYAHCPHSSCTE